MTAVVWAHERDRQSDAQAVSIGLWVFMGVATALFSLFLLANLMRMTSQDWWPLTAPWQLWLSSALLVGGSVALQRASSLADGGKPDAAGVWLHAGGAFAFAFLLSQCWAWSALQAAGVLAAGNPAGSFFYLLTALHGLHVIGGLVGWGVTARAAAGTKPATDVAWRIALCARYWHFLLGLWVALFLAIAWLTPDIARFICGPLRI